MQIEIEWLFLCYRNISLCVRAQRSVLRYSPGLHVPLCWPRIRPCTGVSAVLWYRSAFRRSDASVASFQSHPFRPLRENPVF